MTSILRDDLHWLPVEHQIQFKIGVMTYKALHELAPPYICDVCSDIVQPGATAKLFI